MNFRTLSSIALAVAFAAAPAAQGQSTNQLTFPFQLRVQQDINVFTVANNSTITMPADGVGRPVKVSVTAVYQGKTQAQFTQNPLLFGGTDFTLAKLPPFPIILNPFDTFTFDIQFLPSSSTRIQAQLSLLFLETPATPGGVPTLNAIGFGLIGTAPEFLVSFALQANGNLVPAGVNSTITFLPTVVNTVALATVVIQNRGSGTGPVTSVSISGDGFDLLNLPLLPANVATATDIRFNVRYSPKALTTATGTVQIVLGDRTVNLGLAGSSIGSTYSYEVLRVEGNSPFLPSQQLTVPDTAVGDTTRVTIRVRNTGTNDGVVNFIGVSGVGYQLADVPFLPLTLAPNDFVTFTLTFTPTLAGRSTGRLRFVSDTFDLTALAIGVRLNFAYTIGSAAPVPVLAGGAIVFNPLTVGQTGFLDFTVRNTGTTAATIGSIGVGDTRRVFRIENPPALPLSLDPDGSFTVRIRFLPNNTGLLTAPLLIDAQSFVLSGVGNQPPPLNNVQYSGASGVQEPFQQPSIGLSIPTAYPIDLLGTLILNVSSDDGVVDPAVQFVTGGRTVNFTISANTTRAVFASGENTVRLQTGTVASNLSVVAAIATTAGLILTPDVPVPLRMSVASAAPRLISVQMTSKLTNGFVLQVNGYTTARSLTKADLRFTASPNYAVPTTQFSVDLSAISQTWFRSGTSQAFGGQFSVQIPFSATLQAGTLPPAALPGNQFSLADAVQSVSLSFGNERGTSNTVATDIR